MQIQILELLICDTFSYQWCWKEVIVIPKENHTNARLKCKKLLEDQSFADHSPRHKCRNSPLLDLARLSLPTKFEEGRKREN
jgi:hypothetical protein